MVIEEPLALANTIRQRFLDKQREDEIQRKKEEKEKAEKAKINKNRKKQSKIEDPIFKRGLWCNYFPSKRAKWHYHDGCEKPLKNWLTSSTDLLFVIGFCVIGFLKFVFLSILRYEIKEMIQKIIMLENETNQMNGGLAAVLGVGAEMCSITSSADNNGSRSSPSCHSSQSSFPQPPQTANTVISNNTVITEKQKLALMDSGKYIISVASCDKQSVDLSPS